MLRVVLADDEKKVLLLMRKLIDWEGLGFEIVGMASDGISALDQVREKKPHLLVTDIRMPGKADSAGTAFYHRQRLPPV